jgi:hypothetical protein
LPLTIAIAIAWPANIPLGVSEVVHSRAKAAFSAHNCTQLVVNEPDSVQSLKVRLAWQGDDRPLRDDQVEESDEGDEQDDSRHLTYFIGLMLPSDFISLIPSPALPRSHKTILKPLSFKELNRLRC